MKQIHYFLAVILLSFQFLSSCQKQSEGAYPDGYSDKSEAQIAEPIDIPAVYHSEITSDTDTEGDTSHIFRDELEKEIQHLINNHRRSIGKAPLEFRYELFAAAKAHSSFMANHQVLTHEGFSERVSTIRTILGASGGSAENIAYGYTSAKAVVNSWLNSPGHKKNIEGDYNVTGIGIAVDSKGVKYFTQLFHKVPATEVHH
ncbi:MAG TPA: CAP domain-containing protein [Cytophagaceae bacterium]